MNFLPPIDNPGNRIARNSVQPLNDAIAWPQQQHLTDGNAVGDMSTQELTQVRRRAGENGGVGLGQQQDAARSVEDVGAGSAARIPGINQSVYPMNFNFYAAKKTMAQGLMDIALLTANASQLKALLATQGRHEYYGFLVTMTSISISLQILVAIIFLVVGRMDISVEKNQRALDILNNVATAIVFVITVVNIFISAFGINDPDLVRSAEG